MQGRRSIIICVVASTVSSLMVAAGAYPRFPAAAAVQEKYMHLNICGNKCYHGDSQAGNDLAASVRTSGSSIVSLNEICLNQLTRARSVLAEAGLEYQAIFGQTIQATAPALTSRCTGFGNALLVKRNAGAPAVDTVTRELLPDFGEDRLLLCARVIASNHVACTTHLSPGSNAASEKNRRTQVEKVVALLGAKSTLRPITLSGDLNTKPHSYVLDPLYSGSLPGPSSRVRKLLEVDACATRSMQNSKCNEGTHDRFGTDPKLDYIFVTTNSWSVVDSDATSAVVSDHDPLYGTVTRHF
ncbi:MAG: endonuclease/exonuclease/phosphatase family protein [Sporichthyaceae bacterium]